MLTFLDQNLWHPSSDLFLVQALERLFFPTDPLEELRRCALQVRNHQVHAGARIPAIQAVSQPKKRRQMTKSLCFFRFVLEFFDVFCFVLFICV